MTEHTHIEPGQVDLADSQAEASFYQGQLFIRQDAPEMPDSETIVLQPRSAMKLLEALYKRRYALYMATTLSLGSDDMPAWIASGRPGNVVIDAADDQAERE